MSGLDRLDDETLLIGNTTITFDVDRQELDMISANISNFDSDHKHDDISWTGVSISDDRFKRGNDRVLISGSSTYRAMKRSHWKTPRSCGFGKAFPSRRPTVKRVIVHFGCRTPASGHREIRHRRRHRLDGAHPPDASARRSLEGAYDWVVVLHPVEVGSASRRLEVAIARSRRKSVWHSGSDTVWAGTFLRTVDGRIGYRPAKGAVSRDNTADRSRRGGNDELLNSTL